jgi:hypothetical protein
MYYVYDRIPTISVLSVALALPLIDLEVSVDSSLSPPATTSKSEESQPNPAPMTEKPGTVSNATHPVQYTYAPSTAEEIIAMSADELGCSRN